MPTYEPVPDELPCLPLSSTTGFRRIKITELKPDKNRLLTQNEIIGLVKATPTDSELALALIARRAQFAKDLEFEQARVEKLFKEIEEWITQNVSAADGIDTYAYSGLSFNTWWQDLEKREGINELG